MATEPSSKRAPVAAVDRPEPGGLSSAEAAARLARDGPNEVLERPKRPWLELVRKFWGLSAWMLELIAILSLMLHKTADVLIALALLVLNALLSWWQEQRASTAVEALRRQLRVTARVMRDGSWRPLAARELVAGDVVRIRNGDFVPADLQVIAGELDLDQSALTGESQGVSRAAGEPVYSGSIVRQGEATALVTSTGARTYFGRTTELVDTARPKLHIDEVVSRLVRQLFIVVGVLVGVTLVVSAFRGVSMIEVLPLSLVLLMSAVPVALPVMFTVSMAIGSVELARKGVLVTRLSAAEDAANMDVLCADKTGTLTVNRLSVVAATPAAGFTQDDVIRLGALASQEANSDALDLAFLKAADEAGLARPERQLAFTPFSPATRRTEARLTWTDGAVVRVAKGALATIAGLAGTPPEILKALEAQAEGAAQEGRRTLAVARAAENGPWALVGLAFLADPPRADSQRLIRDLRSLGVTVKMLTGDALPVARAIARELGLGQISRASADNPLALDKVDGVAEIYPEDKFKVVEALQGQGHVVAMTGDGVNDAPALRQSEVGIAVASATDVAKRAASVVLTTEGLGGVVDLVQSGRRIYQRVLTWIINKVSRTILKAGFVTVAYLATGRFVISALGMILLVFMTDFVKIALSTDRTRPSDRPESWRIAPLIRMAVLLGCAMLLEALGLLAIGWRAFGLASDPGRLQTFTFEALLFFALFSILSVRERQAFWASRPSRTLAAALGLDAMIGAAFGLVGVGELAPLPAGELAFVVLYAAVFSLMLNDLIKRWSLARVAPERARK